MSGMTGSPGDAPLLSTRQIADRYGVHPRTVIRWITSRGLAGQRVGGQWRVPQPVMDDWLTRGRMTAATSTAAPAVPAAAASR